MKCRFRSINEDIIGANDHSYLEGFDNVITFAYLVRLKAQCYMIFRSKAKRCFHRDNGKELISYN